jgi:hypothetical protein
MTLPNAMRSILYTMESCSRPSQRRSGIFARPRAKTNNIADAYEMARGWLGVVMRGSSLDVAVADEVVSMLARAMSATRATRMLSFAGVGCGIRLLKLYTSRAITHKICKKHLARKMVAWL